MKHTIHLAAVLLSGLLFVPLDVQGQRFNAYNSSQFSTNPAWVLQVNDLGAIKDIATGKDGEVYIAGRGKLAKYSHDGTRMWAHPGVFSYENYLVAAGPDRIYASEGMGFAFDSEDLAVAGTGIGMRTFDGESAGMLPVVGWILGLGLDDGGNVYTAGVYDSKRIVGLDTLSILGKPTSIDGFGGYELRAYDVFVASYTPEGVPRWGRRLAGYNKDTIMRGCGGDEQHGVFTVDGDGNTYLAGCFGESPVLPWDQPGEITFEEDTRALASYDADGNLRWLRPLADLGVQEESHAREYGSFIHSPYIWDMAVAPDGNLFTSWAISDWHNDDSTKSVVVGGATLSDPGRGGSFIVKHNPDGDILWVRQIAGTRDERICDLATDAEGDVYVGGFFDSPVLQVGDTQLIRSGNRSNGFIARYDGAGNVRWVDHVTDQGVIVYLVAVDSSGDLYRLSHSIDSGCPGAPWWFYEGTAFLAKYSASKITSSEPVLEIPATAALASNYPNPFTHTTTIEYAVPVSGRVRLSVYDILGREVATLVDGVRQAGAHAAVFDGASLPNGRYLYRLEAAGQAHTGLMTRRK